MISPALENVSDGLFGLGEENENEEDKKHKVLNRLPHDSCMTRIAQGVPSWS